jgi:glucosamine-6-phosphate deaminase
MLAPDWWDFTTLPNDLLTDAAKLKEKDMTQLSREGFKVILYDTLEDFYLAEALEYITAWKQATRSKPVGICGPIGPTEQLPLVAVWLMSCSLICLMPTSGEWTNGM